jgi:hypothetical protein
MGPNALWARAWDDLLLSQRGVTTAESDLFDLATLGLADAAVTAGSWVEVRPDGRAPFAAQVLEVRWEEGLFGDGVAVDRQARLGPPPADLAAMLAPAVQRARAPEGSKRAPEYPVLYDRGEYVSGDVVGRSVEPANGATITGGTTTRTFRGRVHTLALLDVGPALARTMVVRRVPGRDGAAVLRLHPPP